MASYVLTCRKNPNKQTNKAKRGQTSEGGGGNFPRGAMRGYPADHKSIESQRTISDSHGDLHLHIVGKCEIYELKLYFTKQIIKCSRIKNDRSS
jgi:hypothetical protein